MSNTNYESHELDVLVVGAGGAGLRAAIEAAELGQKTGVVCKSLLGKAHTVMAEGGVAAALANVEKRDGWQPHFHDTMLGGNFVNNWRMAKIHAQEAPARVLELEKYGAVFNRTDDGRILQRNFGGHQYPRLAHVGDRTGLEIIRTLQDKTIHTGVKVFMEVTIAALFKDGDRVAGALGYYRESGKFVVFHAKAIVLATGGIGKAFRVTSNSWEYTGDGQALAYDVGADLVDMEYIQFHPTGMVWPRSVAGILVTEGVRGEGGVLKNKAGKRFMFDYIPPKYKALYADTEAEADTWVREVTAGTGTTSNARKPPELMSRDVVARAIWTEIKEGRGTENGGVFLDVASRRTADDIKKKLPSMYHQFKELAGVDITAVPMEVGPTCHYVMGGVRVHPETQMSNVKGLFAAGEVAGGLHGSNRLGGNSLSDLLVFGRLAGKGAADFAKAHGAPKLDARQVEARAGELLSPFREGGENPFEIAEALKKIMEQDAGMYRDEAGLTVCLAELEKLKVRAAKVSAEGNIQFNPGWHTAMDLRNLLAVSEASVRSALVRKESRGAHSRLDFPEYSKEFSRKSTIIRNDGGRMQVVLEDIEPMPAELEALFDAKTLKKLRGEEH